MTDARSQFRVDSETGWDPPSQRTSTWRWVSVILDLLNASGYAGEDLTSGTPKWRVVLDDIDGKRWAESGWRRDWGQVEVLQQDWQSRLEGLTTEEVQSQAARWRGE
jgi:hypothetical protein